METTWTIHYPDEIRAEYSKVADEPFVAVCLGLGRVEYCYGNYSTKGEIFDALIESDKGVLYLGVHPYDKDGNFNPEIKRLINPSDFSNTIQSLDKLLLK
ncbi:hypothetical protein HYW74_01025 [Candidatus Pacearchaeota archaeon]|nr:hypothetical protein [Candidatus Pacearchaeota archaeon]